LRVFTVEIIARAGELGNPSTPARLLSAVDGIARSGYNMRMEAVLNILAQPLYLCLFLLRKLQTTFPIVSDSFMGKRGIEVAVVGEFVGWVVLAIIVAAVIFTAMKFVLENASFGTGGSNEIFAVLGSVLSRLIVILVIYVLLSILIYAFANFAHLVLSEMEYVPPAR